MGCISSKLVGDAADRGQSESEDEVVVEVLEVEEEERKNYVDTGKAYLDHVVSLTSTTYGALKLDRQVVGVADVHPPPPKLHKKFINHHHYSPFRKSVSKEEPAEIINAWELMKGLDDDSPMKKPAQSGESPMMKQGRMTSSFSPKDVAVKNVGKENMAPVVPNQRALMKPRLVSAIERARSVGNTPLKPKTLCSSTEKTRSVGSSPLPAAIRNKISPSDMRIQAMRNETARLSPVTVTARKSLGRLFQPEVTTNEDRQERSKDCQAKTPRRVLKAEDDLLQSFAKKCPPGGDTAVLIYTTTLRGIRKTFEECNSARSVVESYGVQIIERDISMDSGFREELRSVMEKNEIRVPVLFIKGYLIGGADEVLKLEEDGKLELLLHGLPRATASCEACGGVRFVLCMDCSGSCKILDKENNNVIKCSVCNENGLIRCPICS